jgi:transmembrane sensor
MMNSKLKAEELIDRYLSGECSPEECAFVESIYAQTALTKTVKDKSLEFDHIGQESWRHIYATINRKTLHSSKKLWMLFTVAASVVLVIGAGLWFYNYDQIVNANKRVIVLNDVLPGKNRATLKLGNGKIINLSNSKTGVVIDALKLTYNDGSNVSSESESAMESGTISTPIGGQYQVKLPDGTNVWLNSASTLHFSSMSAKSAVRNVELNGEAYFEVAKVMVRDEDNNVQRMPFIVKTDKQEIHVLGTHFNINNYQDIGAVTTTLIEGSVRVIASFTKVENVLKPGDQSILTGNGQVKIMPANIRNILAWKNGYFRFDGNRIDEVMRELSRWYDIEVDYSGKISDEKFSGNISKYKNISEVLNMLSYSNDVKFKIEGRRVTVMK